MDEIVFVPQLKIIRVEEDPRYGTFGVLLLQGRAFCITLELPYQMNKQNISCIPTNKTYTCKKIMSDRFKDEVLLVTGVPGREGIEIHPGNTMDDTEGCIIVGSSYSKLKSNNRGVLNSGHAFRLLMAALRDYNTCELTIVTHFG